MVARSAEYWSARRKKQFGRFGSKAFAAYQKPSVGAVAKAAWSGVKYLRTLVNSEVHKLDTLVNTTISATGSITHLSAIGQDDSITGRTGNTVLTTYLSFRGKLTPNGSATATVLRMIIYIDMQQFADTAAGVSDVLINSSTLDHYNPNTVGRFKVLKDMTFALDNVSNKVKYIHQVINLNKHIRFNGTTGSDIQKGGIYVLWLSDEATNTPTVSCRYRLAWHDN